MLSLLILLASIVTLPLLTTARENIVQIKNDGFVEVVEDGQTFRLSFEQISMTSLQAKFTPKMRNQSLPESFTYPIPTKPMKAAIWIKEFAAFLINQVNVRIFYVAERSQNLFVVSEIYTNDFKPSTCTRPFYEFMDTYTTSYGGVSVLTKFSYPARENVNFVLINFPLQSTPFLLFHKYYYNDGEINSRPCHITAIPLGQSQSETSRDGIGTQLQNLKTRWDDQNIGTFWAEEDNNRIFFFMEVHPGLICVQRSRDVRWGEYYIPGDISIDRNPEPIGVSEDFQLEEVEFVPNEWPRHRKDTRPATVPVAVWKQLCADNRVIDESVLQAFKQGD